MKKGYKFGVAWIALNDNPADKDDVESLSSYISVALLADLFEKDQKQVAEDVFKYRQKHGAIGKG